MLDTICITELDVSTAISRLKCNLSSGPDGFPPIMFKRLVSCLTVPLCVAFKQLLSVAMVPDGMEDGSNYSNYPVFKKGEAGSVSNYRPISLTCVPSKILERILANKILQYLTEQNILHPAQHGFVKGRSTCSNLLESLNDWTVCSQSGQQCTIVYIDFGKAFDTVSHKKLFSRLHSYGIRGNVLLWLQNFFTSRTQRTKVGDLFSEARDLISGIVQGSGLGPVMFVIFINELIELLDCFNVKVKLFADDVKLYVKATDYKDIDTLQQAINKLTEWAKLWQLTISIDKCNVLNVGKVNVPSLLNIEGHLLPSVTACRDLGLLVSQNLSPSAHINEIVVKAHHRANIIHRCFTSRNIGRLVRAYTVYVRPLIEHDSILWSPLLKQDIEKVERVQRCFTKRLPGFNDLSYEDRLRRLDLSSLELRRLHTDLTWCYKILFNRVNINSIDFFQLSPTVTKGHAYKLYKSYNSSSIRKSFFSERVVNVWNFLPADTVDFSSLTAFKRTVKLTDLSMFLKCSN